MHRQPLDALVIGAGISGLTTAVCLAEAGLRVEVHTAQPPQETTSAAAGAMWGPYLVEPRDRVRKWSQRTLQELRRLAEDPETGVRLVSGVEASRSPVDPPNWSEQVADFEVCQPADLPTGFVCGWRFTVPLVDMTAYLDYLTRLLAKKGSEIRYRRFRSLAEAADLAPVVVNCAGLGARELVPDPELSPIRGQLVITENPGITEFFSEDTGLSPDLLHVYPHGDTLVLGGTAEPGVSSLEPDQATSRAILERCATVDPRLRDVQILGHRVGLRPTRAKVRVEQGSLGDVTVFHNYGHGGAGVSLSWGCALETTARITGSQ